MTIKDTVFRWTYKFQKMFFKNAQTCRVLNAQIKFVPFYHSGWKECVFKKIVLYFHRRNNIRVSCSIWVVGNWDDIEEIFWRLALINLEKAA